MTATTQPLLKTTAQFREGFFAFRYGQPQEDNPYGLNVSGRSGWFRGWFEAQTRRRIGNTLRRLGVLDQFEGIDNLPVARVAE